MVVIPSLQHRPGSYGSYCTYSDDLKTTKREYQIDRVRRAACKIYMHVLFQKLTAGCLEIVVALVRYSLLRHHSRHDRATLDYDHVCHDAVLSHIANDNIS